MSVSVRMSNSGRDLGTFRFVTRTRLETLGYSTSASEWRLQLHGHTVARGASEPAETQEDTPMTQTTHPAQNHHVPYYKRQEPRGHMSVYGRIIIGTIAAAAVTIGYLMVR